MKCACCSKLQIAAPKQSTASSAFSLNQELILYIGRASIRRPTCCTTMPPSILKIDTSIGLPLADMICKRQSWVLRASLTLKIAFKITTAWKHDFRVKRHSVESHKHMSTSDLKHWTQNCECPWIEINVLFKWKQCMSSNATWVYKSYWRQNVTYSTSSYIQTNKQTNKQTNQANTAIQLNMFFPST